MVRPAVSKPILDRWMECARAEMARANIDEIRCPCRDCRLRFRIRHDCGLLESHLIRRGFMDGYTRWIRDDEDDEDVNAGHDHEDQDVRAADHECQDAGAADHEDKMSVSRLQTEISNKA